MKVLAVIPAFNEAARIRPVLKQIRLFVDQIVVVDDGSTDGTSAAAAGLGAAVCVLRHRVNLGKGAALKTGCEAASRLGADTIVLVDADGQHQPPDIPRLIKALETTGADIVFGSRKIGSTMPLMMRIGNTFLSAVIKLLFGVHVTDTQSGFRVFRAAVFDQIKWNSRNYSVETEMIVNVGKRALRTAEVPIATVYHDKYKGTTVIDGIRILCNILIWKLV